MFNFSRDIHECLQVTTSNQTFDERVAPGAIRDRFNLADLVMIFEIRFPKPIFEERIVVC